MYRYDASVHLLRTKNESTCDQLIKISENPSGIYPVRGACRRYPLSTYIKKKMRGRINGFLCDELHEYNNRSGQGDAMAELFNTSQYFVGMTATLINSYSSGIFHLLYRLVPGLMKKDGKNYCSPGDFDAEYGVVENTCETRDADYNSNRRTSKRKTRSKKLPGVSPLVFSRFLLEYTAFLSLSDMGKALPDYEEIPIPVEMPADVYDAYKETEKILRNVLRDDRRAAQKLLGLLTSRWIRTKIMTSAIFPEMWEEWVEKQRIYEGLLLRTEKEQKRRKSKRTELENQVSFFGAAA